MHILVEILFDIDSKVSVNSSEVQVYHCNQPHTWQASCQSYLIQNSQAVKKECGPEKGYGEKRCEIQGGGQEMAVMVG